VRVESLLLAYLLQIERCLDFWDILVDPALERLEVYGLPDFACHVWWGLLVHGVIGEEIWETICPTRGHAV
jgi:hypothetical protein